MGRGALGMPLSTSTNTKYLASIWVLFSNQAFLLLMPGYYYVTIWRENDIMVKKRS